VTDLAQLAENGETPRNCSLDTGPHHQVGIDAYIASGPQGLYQSAVNWRSWTRKLVLSSSCCAPYNFRFVSIQWQWHHAAGDSADTLVNDPRREGVDCNCNGTTGAIYVRIVSIYVSLVWWQAIAFNHWD